jgi:hypothetical protein
MRVGGQCQAPAALHPGKETRYPSYRRLGDNRENFAIETNVTFSHVKKVKVKVFRYKPEVALGVPGG